MSASHSITLESNLDVCQEERKLTVAWWNITSFLFDDSAYQQCRNYLDSKWYFTNNTYDQDSNTSYVPLSSDRGNRLKSCRIQWIVVVLFLVFIPVISRIYICTHASQRLRAQPFKLCWGIFCGITQDITILAMGLLAIFSVDTVLNAIAECKPIRYLLRLFITKLIFYIFRAILLGAVFFFSTVWCVIDLVLYINLNKERLIKSYIEMSIALAHTGMDSLKAELAEIPVTLSHPVVIFSLYTISVIAFAFLALYWIRLVQCLNLRGRVVCALRLGSFVTVTLLIAVTTTYWMGPVYVHRELDSGMYQLLSQVNGFYWVYRTPNISRTPSIKRFPNSNHTRTSSFNHTFSTNRIPGTNQTNINNLPLKKMPDLSLVWPTEIYTQDNIDASKYPLFRKTLAFDGPKIFDIPGLQSGKMHNVLILVLEAFRAADVGILDPIGKFANSASPTPNLDSLSKQGILYSNFYSNGIQTSRTIPSIMFGSLPIFEGTAMSNNIGRTMFGLPNIMQEMGYHTRFQSAVDTSWDNWEKFLLAHGFDEVLGRGYFNQRMDELNISDRPSSSWGLHDQAALNILAEDLITLHNNGIPFLSFQYTISSHHPFEYPESYVVPDLSGVVFASERDKQKVISVSYVDAQVGILMKRLKAEGILDDTIVMIMGDHGFPVGEHGTDNNNVDPLHNELVNIPFILIAPDMDPKYQGTVIDRAASHVDIFPTIMDMIGIPEDGFWQHGIGESLLRHDESEIVVINSPFSEIFVALVRNKTEKLVFSGSGEFSYTDLSVDPGETNISNNTVSPELVAELKQWGYDLINLYTNLYNTDTLMPKNITKNYLNV